MARLELRIGNERTALEFLPHDERAFVVGSHLGVDVTVPGLSLVEFYFEYRASRIWLVPAFRGHGLTVNSRLVRAPVPIHEYALIEQGTVRIEARMTGRRHAMACDLGGRRGACAGPAPNRAGAPPRNGIAQAADEPETQPFLGAERSQPTVMLWSLLSTDHHLVDHRPVQSTGRTKS